MTDDDLSKRRKARKPQPDESQPDGPPEITMFMDDDRIIFRDQAALDDYVDEARDERWEGPLTDVERGAIKAAGQLWGDLCAIVGDGPTREADLAELIVHIHAIQHAVMAQAAARAYPKDFRLLGSTLRGE